MLGRTVGELLDNTSSAELAEWMAYYSLEPTPEERQDLRHAILWATMRNMWRGKDSRVVDLDDYPLKFEPKPEQSADEMKAIARTIFGGRT